MRPMLVLSHAEEDLFEATLLQVVLEQSLADVGASVWAYGRDQAPQQKNVAASLPKIIGEAAALVFLLSPDSSPTQWMELAYADAFEIPTFILVHRTTFAKLAAAKRGMPPFVVTGQSIRAVEWKRIVEPLRKCCLAGSPIKSMEKS